MCRPISRAIAYRYVDEAPSIHLGWRASRAYPLRLPWEGRYNHLMRQPDGLRLDSGTEVVSQVCGDGTMNWFLKRRPGLISAVAVLRDTAPEYGVEVSRPHPGTGR